MGSFSLSPRVNRLRTQKELMFQSQSEGQKRLMFQLKLSGRRSWFLFSLFILVRFSINWMIPTHTGEGNLPHSIY